MEVKSRRRGEMRCRIRGYEELYETFPIGLTIFGIEVFNKTDANIEILTVPKSKHLRIYVKKPKQKEAE
jgi:hypothetical protein